MTTPLWFKKRKLFLQKRFNPFCPRGKYFTFFNSTKTGLTNDKTQIHEINTADFFR